MIQIFARSWKDAKGNYLNRPGRKTVIEYVNSIEEARKICMDFNDNKRTNAQIRKSYKYEFTSQY